jgi:hypothetical protein
MRTARRIAALVSVVALTACGGGGVELTGPFLVDFEDRPDDGFSVHYDAPLAIAPGVTVTNVDPNATLVDVTTADGFGLGGCGAAAFSGSFFMGIDAAAGVIEITFDVAVSQVEVVASALDGDLVELEAFGAGGVPLGLLDSETSECPALEATDRLEVDAGGNQIVRVEIRGNFVVIDDLTWWVFS